MSNLELRNSNNFTAYNYAVKNRMEFVVFMIDKYHYTTTDMYNEMMNISINRDEIINDYITMDEIKANELDDYLNENQDVFVLKYNNVFCIAFIDEIVNNAIDGKRYPCIRTSDTIYRPSDDMISRDKPIFDIKKIKDIDDSKVKIKLHYIPTFKIIRNNKTYNLLDVNLIPYLDNMSYISFEKKTLNNYNTNKSVSVVDFDCEDLDERLTDLISEYSF
jgi:hypothetical protein